MFYSIVLIGALFVASVSAYTGPLLCFRYCGNEEFNPVCAFDGKKLKMFNSVCELRNAECADPSTWMLRDKGECLANVAKHVEIFGMSKPMLHGSKKKNKVSKKESPRTNPCDLVCPEYFLPICGYDGETYKTFTNLCFLTSASCNAPKEFNQVPADKCNFNTGVVF